jgi:hypothetical protein
MTGVASGGIADVGGVGAFIVATLAGVRDAA